MQPAVKVKVTNLNVFRTKTKIVPSQYIEGTIVGEPEPGSVVIKDSEGNSFYIAPRFDGGQF